MLNPNDQIVSTLFKYINTIRASNQLNIFSRDRMSEHILSTLFRGKKEPPSNNEIEAKFVSNGCAFMDKIIHRLSLVGNNNPNYQQYSSMIDQELNTNKNSPLLSNKIFSHMGLYIKNFEINYYIVFVFSTKLISFDRVIGCSDGNILEGTVLKPDHFVEGVMVKDIGSIRGTAFGPKNIRYNNDTKKFYICLLNSICSSIDNNLKEIKCVYQNNINNIAYGASNALGRNVNFKGGNIAENQIISFKNEDKSQTFNGNCMDFISNLGFSTSNSVGSGTKNKLDIKSRILSYNQNKNNLQNNKACIIFTPKRNNNNGLSTIVEDNNDLNKSFIRNSLPKFEDISPIPTKTLSPGNNYNNKKIASDFTSSLNAVHISPVKNPNFNNILNPFETKNKIQNDNKNINNNNNFNNTNLNNFSFLNSNNNNNPINNNNQIINNEQNKNGILYNSNNIFESIKNIQNANNNMNFNQPNNNIINSINNSIGNPFDNSKNINNNLNNNLFIPNLNNNTQFNQINSNNDNQLNQINSNNMNNNLNSYIPNKMNNNLYIYNNDVNYNNYNNITNMNRPFIKIEKNVVGYQIISNNIKFKSLIDIQNIGNQNINIFPKINFCNNPQFCINLYNINSHGPQSCQTTSRPKEDLINYINNIKRKYPISKNEQIEFVNNNLHIIIEDFYGKKNILTYEKLLEMKKNENNYIFENNNFEKDINMNINDLINKGKYLNIEFPLFNYKQENNSKDKEDKDSSLGSKDNNNILNNSDLESKPISEKLFIKLSKQYLNEEEQKDKYKYNPSFEHLYYSHDFSDVIIKLNNNSILAHKVVLASSSKIFMELIKSAEEEFKNNKNNDYNNNYNYNNGVNIIEILLPENFDFNIFKEIVKWIYCGVINENLSVETIRIMLIMSEKLKIISLVKILIIKYIIPQINKDNAISLCIDAYTRGGSNKETSFCWDILLNYSLNYISKNSVSLIKTNPEKLLIMDNGLLIKCVKICMDNIVEIEQLSNLLQILIQKGIAKNIFELLYIEVDKVKMCRCYDSQKINIDLLLSYFNKNQPFSFPLINEETIENNIIIINNNEINSNNLNISENKNINISPFYLYDADKNNKNLNEKKISLISNKDQSFQSTSIASKKNIFLNNSISNYTFGRNDENSLNNSNINNSSSNISETNNNFNIHDNNEEEKAYNNIYNYLSPNTNTNYAENLINDKYHVFDFIFQFPNDLKFADIRLNEGVSIFSEKFEYREHLWSIKIDINKKGDFSFFIIERGPSNNFDKNNSLLKYSSILFEFIIRDSNFEKSNQIFFSFVKNQHQIIGHKNFININQLTNKNKFHFILYIKRFPLHSGILQYLNDNFNFIFLNKNNIIDKNKNIYLMPKEYFNNYKNIKDCKNDNNNSNPYQMYSNNNQKNFIDLIISENEYLNWKNQINNDIRFEYLNISQFDLVYLLYSDYLPVESENNVIGALYFYCMKKDPKDIDNIMKGIRYEFVNFRILCSLAKDHNVIKNSPTFRKEFKIELNKRIKKLNENNNLVSNNKRISLRKNIKRKNYNYSNNDDGLSGMNISDEIIKFFLEKGNNEEYKDKLIFLKKELQEEKKITNERIKNLEKENIQLNLDKNRLIYENKIMKKKFINTIKINQNNSINNENKNLYNNNHNSPNQVDDNINYNYDHNCLIF